MSDGPIKVCLIQPTVPFVPDAVVPLSIIGLASILREAGMEVTLIDSRRRGLSIAQVLEQIQGLAPDVVGITGLNSAYRWIRGFCQDFKKAHPGVPLLAGGDFITGGVTEAVLREAPIDVACIADGEDIIVELVQRVARRESIEGLPNVAWLENGEYRQEKIQNCADLDRYPLPAYDLLDMEPYLAMSEGFKTYDYYFTIISGRGCKYHCYYCNNRFHKVVEHSPDYLIRHMNYLNDTYGLTHFNLTEEDLFHPKDRLLELCRKLVENGRPYYLTGTGCAQHLDEDILEALKTANFVQVCVAVEHWDKEVISGFHRTLHHSRALEAIGLIQKSGFRNGGFNILWGHPKDTMASIREAHRISCQVVREYGLTQFNLTPLVVYQNSHYQRDALRMGKIKNFENYMYAMRGFSPFVNLTSLDDDRYRQFPREVQIIEEMKLNWKGVAYLLRQWRRTGRCDWELLGKGLAALPREAGKLAALRLLLALPLAARKPFRKRIEALLGAAMYEPDRIVKRYEDYYPPGHLTSVYYNEEVCEVVAHQGQFQWMRKDIARSLGGSGA